jgi:hypothetical protein
MLRWSLPCLFSGSFCTLLFDQALDGAMVSSSSAQIPRDIQQSLFFSRLDSSTRMFHAGMDLFLFLNSTAFHASAQSPNYNAGAIWSDTHRGHQRC